MLYDFLKHFDEFSTFTKNNGQIWIRILVIDLETDQENSFNLTDPNNITMVSAYGCPGST